MSSVNSLEHDNLHKVNENPFGITGEDTRRLSANYTTLDDRTARIISVIDAMGAAAQVIQDQAPVMDQAPNTSLLTIVNDLKAAVDKSPHDITPEILKLTQGIVSKMQRSVGQVNTPHPELEAELRAEYAKIEPKVEQGTVTKAEADHLHSLEARAHGHTEKGGLTAMAQSVSSKRERALSLGNHTNESTPSAAKDVSDPDRSSDKETRVQMADLESSEKIEVK